jgi:nicotinamidase-related amidase
MSEIKRHEKLLKSDKTALLVIDIQERILKVIRKNKLLIKDVLKLIQGIKVLGIPIYYTEQYPKGLGETAKEIREELVGEPIQKLSFSCSGAGNLFEQLKEKNISQVIVCGIETHVCVQQTVLDLLANGFEVTVPANAVSSRTKIDYKTALQRMEKHGAEVSTVEAILFELLNICTTQEFKDIARIIK